MAKAEKATDAARREAEERDVNIASVEGSGSDGSITVDDVKAKAVEEEEKEHRMVRVKLNPALLSDVGTSSDGKTYRDGDTVSKRHFDEVLSKDKDVDGNRIFHSGGEI